MKNKIVKILDNTKIVIPVVLVIVLGLGFFVYKNVGLTPKVNLDSENNTNLSVLDSSLQDFKDGEVINLAFPKSGRVNAVSVKEGEVVKKGQILASLDGADALGALQIAKANYEKVLNGATGADIDVLKATVKTAEINLENTKKQQELAVKNTYSNLLNSTIEVVPSDGTSDYSAPIISGNYNMGKEGVIKIHLYYSTGGISFTASDLVSDNTGIVNITTAQPIGNSGLYIKFNDSIRFNVTDWEINIPNKKASNYLANYNAYQSALETQTRLISLAQANLDQSNSALALKQSSARPEDVASALGSLQIAQGAYNNNFIYASAPGIISVVNINPGEIVTVNQKVVSLIVKNK
jgi:multidrug efflux pump subunit AcrA (membrane-fusion protein)